MKFNRVIILVSFFIYSNLRSQSGFLPSDISGLSLWLTGDSVSLSSGSNIDTCYDLSPNLNHARQPISNAQPKRIMSTALNGHHVMRFDTLVDFVDDYLKFVSINNIRTVFWVVKEDTNASSKYRSLLGHSDVNTYHFLRGDNKEIWHSVYADPAVKTGQTKLNFTSINGTSTLLPKNYAIISLVTTGNVSAENFSNDRGIAGRYWYGDLAELVIYNQALTAIETMQVEQYLNDKYAPPITLPADISILNSFCDTTLIPGGSFKNYQWSTGATTPTISISTSGKYWVTATNIFGQISSDTMYVTYPNVNFLSDSIFCTGDSLQWDTQLSSFDYTFLWQDLTNDSVFKIKQAGNYFVKITDSFGCTISSDTAIVIEDLFANNVTLGQDDSLCAGNYITLTNGASPSLTYTWSTNSNNDSLLVNLSGQYSVIVTNTNNCVARDTININIIGQAPVPEFTTSIGCIGSAVSFTNMSNAPSGTLTGSYWDFGDPISSPSHTSAATNPFHTFSDTGTYTIRLTAFTSAGCEQTLSKTIHIAPVPTVSFSISNLCQNDSAAFLNQSTSVAGYSITSLNWNFGDPVSGSLNTSNSSNPKHVFSSQTIYTVSLTATNNAGCSSTLSNSITVKPQVKADFTYSTPCTNTTTVFQDNSIASSTVATTRSWNFGNGPVSGLTVTRTYTATGPYLVSLTVTVNGCTSNTSKIITIFSPPIPDFTIPASCIKDTVTAINSSVAQSGIISSYNWKLNNMPFSSIQNPTLSLSSAGNYPVRLTVVNSFGCKDSVTKNISVYPLPNVDFTTNPTTYYYINSPVNFIPSIANANSYLWSISGAPTTTAQNPTYTFTTAGTFTVMLDLRDQQGCRNSKTKSILVSKPYLDLTILNVNTTKDNDGFMTVEAEIANYGTIPVSTFDIHYKISDGGNNKETWTGTLIPNAFFTYTFNSKSSSLINSTNNITCVDIEKVNGINDANQNNNSLCNVINTDEIAVSNPIPNPAEGDVTLPVILNKDIEFSITIYNSNGQLLYETTTQKGTEGLNLILLPTSSYSRGAYIIKAVIDDKIFNKKFIKISNK